ncbi:MAG TPA: hypothetical protein VMU04_10215 [Candidatus Acidoferrum sp.]|nr:hypothetical protein [Candidatus Acidoferrum sp.]
MKSKVPVPAPAPGVTAQHKARSAEEKLLAQELEADLAGKKSRARGDARPPRAMPEPVAITSLSQLETLSNGAPVIVDVKLAGQFVRFTGRRLKPVEAKEIKLLLDASMPPMLPPEKEGMPMRYDYRDPGYLRKVEENRRKARALALHTAYPIFREAMASEDGPVDENRIVQFVEGRNVDDDVLEVLFKKVIEPVVEVQALASFI